MEVALGARGPIIMVTQGYRDGGGEEVPGWDFARSCHDGGGIGGKGPRHNGNPGLPGWGLPGVTGTGVARGYREGGGQGLPRWGWAIKRAAATYPKDKDVWAAP